MIQLCKFTSCEYAHCLLISSLCVHSSTIFPWSRTMILSACMTVCSLWAITMTVFHCVSFLSDCVMWCSDIESRAEVGSSRMIMGGFLINNLASASLCCSPHDSFNHFSPIFVRSHWGLDLISSSRCVWCSAFRNISSFFSSEIISISLSDNA